MSKHGNEESNTKLGRYLREMDELKQISAVYNSAQPSEFDFVDVVKNIYQNNQYRILSDPQIT
jgi:hypothetical protein